MIKSTKTTLKFSNKNKLADISTFIVEYQRVVSLFIDLLWGLEDIKCLLDKELTSNIDSWLSARAVQCAGKQASGIVRGVKKKQSKRLYQLNKFKSQGLARRARLLQKIYDNTKLSKPSVVGLQPELDSRFVLVDLNNTTSFDGWLNLGSLGNGLQIAMPFKRTKHFNSLARRGELKGGIRISLEDITLMFELPESNKVVVGKVVGIDIGQTTTLTCSNGQAIEADNHNHTYKSICEKLARKKKGSKNFEQAVKHRSNYIHWVVNQLVLTGIKQVNLENIKHLRRGKTSSKSLSHWNYAELFEKLAAKLEDAGVQITQVSPTYTSQRCSACGWTCKSNRKGKRFRCAKCSFECDADLNGSLNISFDLPPIKKEERLRQLNRKGFYWFVKGEEPIVPPVLKACLIFQ